MILNHPTLSESEVKLLVQASESVYQNQMSLDGWEVITPDLTNQDYGLDPELITGNTFKLEGDIFGLPFGDANAAVLKSGDNLLLAFRGTEIPEGDEGYWTRLEEHYDLFEPLFQALDNYIQTNPASKILVTGHSLGGAMAELYMAEHPGNQYSAVPVASPLASNDPEDVRILNIGFENDPVYEITSGDPFGVGIGGADTNNSTTDLYLDLDKTGLFGINNHASSNYIYATNRLFNSGYYNKIERDSFVIIDRKDSDLKVSDVFLSTNQNAFILGEDNKADNITGDKKNDILEGLGGNDTLKGDLISASFFSGDDTLDGGSGNDLLDGSKGEDVAVFSDEYTIENYDIETTGTSNKTTTVTHKNGGIDGVDTLKNIEFGQFNGETVDVGNQAFAASGGEDKSVRRAFVAADSGTGSPPPRIIPLPLEDGEEDTETVQATDTTANPNPNDPPTPPYVSLTAPVAMLDGDVDYTLNISPYKPDIQHNVVYIIDTSSSIDAVELQTMKDAYTNLTNYFVAQGIAENTNFGVVSFDSQARFSLDSGGSQNLTADEALAAIQSLTTDTGIGTKYFDGLNKADQFLLNSTFNPFFTTGIGYFVSDGQNSSDRLDMLLKARDVRELANVQAFGLDPNNAFPLMARDINWIDSNQGVMLDSFSKLSTELNKSGLANQVAQVNISVDGEVVDTVQPNQLTDSPLGLTYEGSVEDLDVSIDAENIVTAEVVYTPQSNLAATDVDYTVTAGEGKLTDENGNPIDESNNTSGDEDPFARIRNGGDGNDDIILP